MVVAFQRLLGLLRHNIASWAAKLTFYLQPLLPRVKRHGLLLQLAYEMDASSLAEPEAIAASHLPLRLATKARISYGWSHCVHFPQNSTSNNTHTTHKRNHCPIGC